MRLFCGLSLAYEVRRNLELLLQHLRAQADIQWSPPDNLHITTKFIGEWPDDRVDEVRRALAEIPPAGAMKIAVRGLGWFPNPHSPRVLFAGVDAPQELHDLHAAADSQLAAIGVKAESKPYHPHLTLARIKSASGLAPLRQAIAGLPSADFGVFTAAKHLLYRSKLTPSGSQYSVIAEFPFS
jgi:2'-5' RNA ligase